MQINPCLECLTSKCISGVCELNNPGNENFILTWSFVFCIVYPFNGSTQFIRINSSFNYTFFIGITISSSISHLYVGATSILTFFTTIIIQFWSRFLLCLDHSNPILKWTKLLNVFIIKIIDSSYSLEHFDVINRFPSKWSLFLNVFLL